ncbi:MAG TPA: TonB-dependent receptor [Steroidobacteraceae bacterium]|nr:TonB-dependent receptor [Steroidobacteraceae bacterium]
MPTLTVRSLVSKTLRAAGARRIAGASLPMMLLAMAGPAMAQTAPAATTAGAETLEEIVVTGIRHAVQESVEVKRDSGNIVEAVSAEDIGKLPDISIADSLSRLPGVTAQRAAGRQSAISVRGTDPAFTTALLNGREQVSTGDNRDIEFDQYPSELFSGAVVHKTPDASLIGQGLSGTIDLQTQRPLAYGKQAIAFNARAERNSNADLGANSDDTGYRVSFSYIDQYFDNTLGLTIGYARLKTPLATQGVGAYTPWHANDPAVDSYNFHPSIPTGVYVTNGMKVRADMGEEIRDGAMATLEWRPSQLYTMTLDAYYTKSDTTDDARSLEWNLGNYPYPTTYSNLVIRDNTLVGASVDNVRPLVRNFQFITNDKIEAIGWNHKFNVNEWTFIGDLSWSKATRDQFQPETNAQYGTCAGGSVDPPDLSCFDSGQFLLSASGMPSATFVKNYADPTQIAFGPTIYGAGYVKKPHVEDELKSARIDVTHTGYGWFHDFTGSINYSDRTKDKSSPENSLSTLAPGAVSIGSQYLLNPTNLSYAGLGNALAWNVPAVLAAYYQPITYHVATDPGYAYLVGKAWTVEEKVSTTSLRGSLDHQLSSSVTLKGNIGVQIIGTDQRSDGYAIDGVNGGAVSPISADKKYTDVLPQFNFAFLLPEDQVFRVGIAREMARARMDQLKNATDQGIATSGGQPGGSAGNPLLDPWRADAFDLSYEKYFDHNKGYFSAAVFFKNLRSYIYNSTYANYDFSKLLSNIPPNYFGTGCPNAQGQYVGSGGQPCPQFFTTGSLQVPLNGEGGKLKGVELSASIPGEVLGEVLRNWGALFSIAQTQSNIEINDPPAGSNSLISTNGLGVIPLPGLSKTVWNATLFYENNGFAARIATNARSKYIGEITNFSNDRTFQYVKGNQITDFQTSYEWQEGRMKGFMVLFQINNLTNEPYVSYDKTEARVIDYQTYGKQFLLGFNYKH